MMELTVEQVQSIRDAVDSIVPGQVRMAVRDLLADRDSLKHRLYEATCVLENARDVCLAHDATADEPILTDAEYYRIQQVLAPGAE